MPALVVFANGTKTSIGYSINAKTVELGRKLGYNEKVCKATGEVAEAVTDIVLTEAMNGSSYSSFTVAFFKIASAQTSLSNSEKELCISAFSKFGAEVVATGVLYAEVNALPPLAPLAMTLQSAMVAKQTYDLIDAAYKTHQQCGPLVVQGYAEAKTDFSAQGADALRQLQNLLLSGSSMGVGF